LGLKGLITLVSAAKSHYGPLQLYKTLPRGNITNGTNINYKANYKATTITYKQLQKTQIEPESLKKFRL